ncbi:cytochrome P450 9e2-like [Chrysoperla carnea]|uniref:cytochrome P450 9e2-like n=1 Tax=Chrysoperla carnea TaxID=189513 RepID=UPI001D090517|nr:cytochrome P450 9e2-like [Chrysoperla carnea]
MFFIIFGIIGILVLFHVYFMKLYKYWDQNGIPTYLRYHPYIDFVRVILNKNNFHEDIIQLYNGLPDKQVYGSYPFRIPQLIVKDPDIIRNIMVKDFDHFVNHLDGFFNADPLFGKSLFALKDKKWRDMRTILSPVFTGSKLRGLCELISECGTQTMDHYSEMCRQKQNNVLKIDFLDACTRFTNDVIASVAFGIKVNSLTHPNNEFFNAGHEISKFATWRMFLIFKFPSLCKIFKIRFAPNYVYDFFTNITESTLRARKEQNIMRYDIIYLLTEAQKEQIKNDPSSKNILTTEDITSQVVIFFLAGYANVAIIMAFAAYELALQPDLQKRLQKEIDTVLKENNGKLDYEVIKSMKFLDMVVTETLRKWPPSAALDRQCNKSFEINTNNNETINVKPGMIINIPVMGLHYDPKYYPNPEKFDPERFNDENKAKLNPYTYLPFGYGPRVCIASRFVILETKMFLIQLLSKFNVVVTEKTPIPIRLVRGSILKPDTDFGLGLQLRQ